MREGEVTTDVFAVLTCEPKAEVGRVRPYAMPVILTTPEQHEVWLRAPWDEAKVLRRLFQTPRCGSWRPAASRIRAKPAPLGWATPS